MKKILVVAGAGMLLTGCVSQTVTYNKKSQDIEVLEDTLEDKLAAENPGRKFDVDISEENKKKKKKKKK